VVPPPPRTPEDDFQLSFLNSLRAHLSNGGSLKRDRQAIDPFLPSRTRTTFPEREVEGHLVTREGDPTPYFIARETYRPTGNKVLPGKKGGSPLAISYHVATIDPDGVVPRLITSGSEAELKRQGFTITERLFGRVGSVPESRMAINRYDIQVAETTRRTSKSLREVIQLFENLPADLKRMEPITNEDLARAMTNSITVAMRKTMTSAISRGIAGGGGRISEGALAGGLEATAGRVGIATAPSAETTAILNEKMGSILKLTGKRTSGTLSEAEATELSSIEAKSGMSADDIVAAYHEAISSAAESASLPVSAIPPPAETVEESLTPSLRTAWARVRGSVTQGQPAKIEALSDLFISMQDDAASKGLEVHFPDIIPAKGDPSRALLEDGRIRVQLPNGQMTPLMRTEEAVTFLDKFDPTADADRLALYADPGTIPSDGIKGGGCV
jgi:hypothetical protein